MFCYLFEFYYKRFSNRVFIFKDIHLFKDILLFHSFNNALSPLSLFTEPSKKSARSRTPSTSWSRSLPSPAPLWRTWWTHGWLWRKRLQWRRTASSSTATSASSSAPVILPPHVLLAISEFGDFQTTHVIVTKVSLSCTSSIWNVLTIWKEMSLINFWKRV